MIRTAGTLAVTIDIHQTFDAPTILQVTGRCRNSAVGARRALRTLPASCITDGRCRGTIRCQEASDAHLGGGIAEGSILIALTWRTFGVGGARCPTLMSCGRTDLARVAVTTRTAGTALPQDADRRAGVAVGIGLTLDASKRGAASKLAGVAR